MSTAPGSSGGGYEAAAEKADRRLNSYATAASIVQRIKELREGGSPFFESLGLLPGSKDQTPEEVTQTLKQTAEDLQFAAEMAAGEERSYSSLSQKAGAFILRN